MLEKKLDLAHKLGECVVTCNYCFNACLEEDDVKMMKECIKLDKECAAICQSTLGLLNKGGHFVKEALDICEKVCESCAEECAKYPHEHCRICAKVCNECAEACREFQQLIRK